MIFPYHCWFENLKEVQVFKYFLRPIWSPNNLHKKRLSVKLQRNQACDGLLRGEQTEKQKIGWLCYINSPLSLLSQVSHYMSSGQNPSECFLFELEPNIANIPIDAYHRKPSYDDILCELLEPTIENIPEVDPAVVQRPKPKRGSGETAEKREKKKQSGKASMDGQQRGHWKLEENKRYHWFLEIHSSHFINKHMRRMDKIFKTMERFVGTREAEQCRSHHQKMEKKYGSFANILKELRRQIYGSGDVDCILSEMKSAGLEVAEDLLSWAFLENEAERISEPESEKSTINEVSPVNNFIDPLAELECQYQHDFQLLVL